MKYFIELVRESEGRVIWRCQTNHLSGTLDLLKQELYSEIEQVSEVNSEVIIRIVVRSY
jgi:hypothetical protein